MTKERFRLRFTFWLDMNKPDEESIAEQITELKEKRQFSKVVRDGIRLVSSLMRGEIDILIELFPFVIDEIPRKKNNGKENELHKSIARIEELILQNKLRSSSMLISDQETSRQPLQGPKVMDVPKFDLPTFEDNDDDFNDLVITKSTSTDSVENFKRAIAGLN